MGSGKFMPRRHFQLLAAANHRISIAKGCSHVYAQPGFVNASVRLAAFVLELSLNCIADQLVKISHGARRTRPDLTGSEWGFAGRDFPFILRVLFILFQVSCAQCDDVVAIAVGRKDIHPSYGTLLVVGSRHFNAHRLLSNLVDRVWFPLVGITHLLESGVDALGGRILAV